MKRILQLTVLLFLIAIIPTAQASAQTVEETVREYFADIPVMIEVARCESKFRQFADSGNVFRGGGGGQMVGVFQFFDVYHFGPAATLGLDIETLDGNLAYARVVYEQQGTTPWNSARGCWDVPLPLAAAIAQPTNSATVTSGVTDEALLAKIDQLRQIISLLQTLLALRAQV